MTSRSECISKTKRDGDWVYEGHEYEAFLAIYDRDTDRTYTVDRCERCDKRQASWSHGKSTEIEHYPQFVQVGGVR